MTQRLENLVRTEVAAVLGVRPDEVGLDTAFTGVNRMDSLEIVEIGVRLERALGRQLPVETVERIGCVRDLVAALDAHLAPVAAQAHP
jgi:acyl carrier protein